MIAKGRNFTRGLRASPLVLAGCFDGLPEQPYLDSILTRGNHLAYAEERGQVLLAAALLQPQLIVLPSADARGVSTRSIISRCLSLSRRPPAMLTILSLLPGARRSATRCAYPGVVVAATQTAEELADAVEDMLRRPERPPLRLLA